MLLHNPYVSGSSGHTALTFKTDRQHMQVSLDKRYGLGVRDLTGSGGWRTVIDGDGNLGIGTTSPTAKLDVNGTTRLRGDVTMDSSLNVTGNVLIGGNVVGFSSINRSIPPVIQVGLPRAIDIGSLPTNAKTNFWVTTDPYDFFDSLAYIFVILGIDSISTAVITARFVTIRNNASEILATGDITIRISGSNYNILTEGKNHEDGSTLPSTAFRLTAFNDIHLLEWSIPQAGYIMAVTYFDFEVMRWS